MQNKSTTPKRAYNRSSVIPCKSCGNPFTALANRVARGMANTCSRKCHVAYYYGATWEERFWKRVNKTETCWLWTGKFRTGYGTFRKSESVSPMGTHRIAWELIRGPIPDGLFVCHNCPGGDNPACCNPDHMFLGTQKDNIADAVKKGRVSRGETHPTATLTNADAISIRARIAAGEKQQSIADSLGITQSHVSAIVNRKIWKHVD